MFLIEPLFKLSEDDGVKNSTPERNMKEISHQMLQKVRYQPQQTDLNFNIRIIYIYMSVLLNLGHDFPFLIKKYGFPKLCQK